MLLAYLPEQVEKMWEVVGPALLRAFPEHFSKNAYTAINLLKAILCEDATLWGWFEEEETMPRAFALTAVQIDPVLGHRTLFIYAVASIAPLNNRAVWEEGQEVLIRYARKRGCVSITTYSNHDALIKALGLIGWNSEFTQLVRTV